MTSHLCAGQNEGKRATCFGCGVVLFLCAGWPALDCHANVAEKRNDTSDDVPPSAPLYERVDEWYDRMSAVIADPFARVDQFFGDESIADEGRRTRLRVGVGVRGDVVNGWRMLTDFSLRVALPRIEERWQLFLNELASEDDISDVSDLTRPPIDTDPDFGLRYFLLRDLRMSIRADGGYRFSSPRQAFVRLRGRTRYRPGRWALDVTQAVTYFTHDGWRSQSEISARLPLADVYGIRSLSRLTWEEISSGYKPEQSIALYRELTARRAWRLEGRGVWQNMPNPSDIIYTVEFVYRQLLHRNWLFVEIAPGVEYAESKNYDPNPFILLQFEILFNAE